MSPYARAKLFDLLLIQTLISKLPVPILERIQNYNENTARANRPILLLNTFQQGAIVNQTCLIDV
jgi:hypothetical protein